MSRILAIGDIHGGLKALVQVLESAGVAADDTLIFLGDYVDGWSESAQTIEYVIDLSKQQRCIFIKGNHDMWCEDWLRTGEANRTWLQHGGEATIKSYENLNISGRQKHLSFLATMPFYYVDEKNRLFIHAGFTSMHGPVQEFHQSNFSWDRTLWEMALSLSRYIDDSSELPQRLKLFHEIFIGHTPTINYGDEKPMKACNVWNIDTGAAFTGKLTIMNVDTKEYWQSEVVKKLYPGEKGRNKN